MRGALFPSSRHPGIVNVLLTDASVRAVKTTVSIPTWEGLGTIAGGEILSADSF